MRDVLIRPVAQATCIDPSAIDGYIQNCEAVHAKIVKDKGFQWEHNAECIQKEIEMWQDLKKSAVEKTDDTVS